MQSRQLLDRDAARRGMATVAEGYLIKLYELANLSSCRHGTLHQHDPRQLPLRQGSPSEDPSERIHAWLHPKKGLADESSTPPPLAEAAPSQTETASTASGSLQLNIALRIYWRYALEAIIEMMIFHCIHVSYCVP